MIFPSGSIIFKLGKLLISIKWHKEHLLQFGSNVSLQKIFFTTFKRISKHLGVLLVDNKYACDNLLSL